MSHISWVSRWQYINIDKEGSKCALKKNAIESIAFGNKCFWFNSIFFSVCIPNLIDKIRGQYYLFIVGGLHNDER